MDFHALGEEIKRKRIERGWTQEYLGQLVDRSARSIMYFENRGKHPSLDVFYKLVTLLGISVDQFFFPQEHTEANENRLKIDILLKSMDERETAILLSTAVGICGSRNP